MLEIVLELQKPEFKTSSVILTPAHFICVSVSSVIADINTFSLGLLQKLKEIMYSAYLGFVLFCFVFVIV